MSLEYAILGFLNYGDFSGYDLKKAFDASISHFWPADRTQIYRTLGRLAENQWVEVEVVEQDEAPDRKVYHLTEAGRAALREWLATPHPPEKARLASLIQVFFAAQLDNAEILALLEAEAQDIKASLAYYDHVPQQSTSYIEMGSAREIFFWRLTLDYGIKTAQARLAWVEQAIAQIKRGDVPSD
jgi:PadR family transcriptional regulator, regulatory protein AphA